MIIQTGLRTDIPAFYAPWFANRLREGFVLVRNPYNYHQVTRYRLNPQVVDLIAFCSKNPAPLLPYGELLAPYGQYWFVTITPYGRAVEPHVPDKRAVVQSFRELSRRLGPHCVGWRYDPIFLSDVYSIEYHLHAFEKIAAALAGFTHTCVISFIDLYQKVRRNFPEAREVSPADRLTLGKEMIRIAGRYDMVLRPCAEGDELAPYGADCGGCMTIAVYESALRTRLRAPKRKSPRSECACFMGNDIGLYDTCPHLCRYCYANNDPTAVARNRRRHDPLSPFLIGTGEASDILHEARQESWVDGQLTLEF